MSLPIADSLRESHNDARQCVISQRIPSTLRDLLSVVEAQEGSQSHLAAMLRATAAHLSMYFDRSPERCRHRFKRESFSPV